MTAPSPALPPTSLARRLPAALAWVAVAGLGAFAFGWLAVSRGEPVSAAWLLVAAACTYAIGYRFYSAFLAAKVFALDDARATPAERLADGRDFVPTNKWIVFGHHFAAIAGPGPLVGPTLAAQFGYLPGILWIVVGVVVGGAVQDFVILVASMRRDGKSLGEMAREEIGPVAGFTAMVAVLGIMLVLIAVLALVVVNALRASPWGTVTLGLTIPIAVLMGIYMRWIRPGRVLEASAIGLVLLFVALYAGRWVAENPALAGSFTLTGRTLAILVMAYGFAASVLPVWLLLAPRDYLSAFVKIGVISALAVGILIALPPLQMPALTRFTDGTGPVFAGALFPFAFITIACGSISGFHALIASGTTPRLLARERDARMIGYGAMLMESFVAVMALIAACALTPGVYFAINAPAAALGTTAQGAAHAIAQWGFVVTPAELDTLARNVGESSLLSRTGGAPSLAVGMAHIFSRVLGGGSAMALWYHFAIMFEALFILTTLDAGTRVGRFMLQDIGKRVWPRFGLTTWTPAVVLSSALFVAMWGHFLWQGVIDPLGGINSLWPLFGISNQLLAAVALCVGTTVIMRNAPSRYALVTLVPLAFLVVVTMSAGWAKLFSPLPRLGFIAHAHSLAAARAAGVLPAGVKTSGDLLRMIANDYLDAAVAAFFLISVLIVIADSARVWLQLLTIHPRPIRMPRKTAALLAFLAPLALLAPLSLQAQSRPASDFDFTIRNIMRGPELYGRAPTNVRWSADSRWIHFQWNAPGTDWREPLRPYRVRAERGAAPERLTFAQADSAEPYVAEGPRSPDGRSRVVEANGDIYVVPLGTGPARRLTQTVAAESHPSWSADGRTVYFVRESNAFAVSLADGSTRQLTDIRTGPEPKDSARATGQRGRLEQQQRDLFDVVRDRLAADSSAAAERKARAAAGLQPVYLGTSERVSSIDVSPDGRAAIVVLTTAATANRQAEVPQFVTTSGYVESLKIRTKVGDAVSHQRALWLSLPSGSATPLNLFATDTTTGTIALAGWNRDGSRAALFAFPRDHKSRVLYTLGSGAPTLTPIETLRDTAWVGGPCSSCAGWYAGGRRLWFVSESTGFAQLYSAAASGGDVRALTHGRWEVLGVDHASDARDFLLTANERSPAEQQAYHLSPAGGALVRITSASGGHNVTESPDGRWIADVHSFVNQPPELYLQANTAGAEPMRLTTSPTAEFARANWLAPEIVQIPASDGARVPAHIYRPQEMGASPNGAAVIFVHGAGYLHNVGNFWSEYPREYLFNQLLAKHGYVVLDVDYRASAGYGRDWRTAIYRWMGGRDLQDQVDASKWLTSTYGIPGSRIGMYGGSYGGFMTLMALFTAQDYFGAGAALRSVTDWAHYNEGYTSSILNRPQDDTLAYRRSSPIYFASGLRSPLLMAHGMADQNVHYQDIVRLEQRLIELGKTDWTLASYPVEDHGFVRPTSWTDEYTRIFDLFERTIAKPAGAK